MLILILIGPVVLVKRDIGSMATQKEYILMKSPKTGLGIKQQRYSDAIRNSFKIFVLFSDNIKSIYYFILSYYTSSAIHSYR